MLLTFMVTWHLGRRAMSPWSVSLLFFTSGHSVEWQTEQCWQGEWKMMMSIVMTMINDSVIPFIASYSSAIYVPAQLIVCWPQTPFPLLRALAIQFRVLDIEQSETNVVMALRRELIRVAYLPCGGNNETCHVYYVMKLSEQAVFFLFCVSL